jgi:hypothetical protein
VTALDHSIEKYPDSLLETAILDAIEACNRRVTNYDIISFMFGNLLTTNKWRKVDTTEKRFLNYRISEWMDARYPVEYQNSKSKTWLVK